MNLSSFKNSYNTRYNIRYNTILTDFLQQPYSRSDFLWNTWSYCCVKYFGTIHKRNSPENPLLGGSGISYWDSWKGSTVMLSRGVWPFPGLGKETHPRTDISPFRQPDVLLKLQNNNVNLCLCDWGVSCWFMRLDLQILRQRSCLCEDGLFIYTVCLGSSESQCREFHHALYGTHVWSPPRCSFTPRHGWGDHISMCGSGVVLWCSVCNLQDTFLGLPVTLLEFRAVW